MIIIFDFIWKLIKIDDKLNVLVEKWEKNLLKIYEF